MLAFVGSCSRVNVYNVIMFILVAPFAYKQLATMLTGRLAEFFRDFCFFRIFCNATCQDLFWGQILKEGIARVHPLAVLCKVRFVWGCQMASATHVLCSCRTFRGFYGSGFLYTLAALFVMVFILVAPFAYPHFRTILAGCLAEFIRNFRGFRIFCNATCLRCIGQPKLANSSSVGWV